MSQQFPPAPDHPDDIARLLEVFICVADLHSAIYLSAPITSGKRLLAQRRDRLRNSDLADRPKSEFFKQVISENRHHAVATAKRLRDAFPSVVIDPTVLEDIPGWTQCDYRDFWGRVIERYARKVVLADDWQYSSGCSYEFLVASRNGIATLDERFQPLSRTAGLLLITEAINDIRAADSSTDFLEGVREQLEHLRQKAV